MHKAHLKQNLSVPNWGWFVNATPTARSARAHAHAHAVFVFSFPRKKGRERGEGGRENGVHNTPIVVDINHTTRSDTSIVAFAKKL
jgi:hypothetical protein